MSFYRTFKKTEEVNLQPIFASHLSKTFGNEFLNQTNPFFIEMAQKRNELDYQKYEKLIIGDMRLCQELEAKITNYLRYLYFLDSKFRFEPHHPNSIQLPIQWEDSLSPGYKLKTPLMKQEICNQLYNLALCQLMQGCHLLFSTNDSSKTEAIKKFQIGIWAVREIVQLLPSFANSQTLQLDLNFQNLSCIQNQMIGFSYLALFEIHEKNEVNLGLNNIASIANEASKNFKFSYEIIKNNPKIYQDSHYQKSKSFLSFYSYYTEAVGLMKFARHHQNLIDEKPLEGHMGFAVSYMKKAARIINEARQSSNNFNVLPISMKDKLKQLVDQINAEIFQMEKKNNQIYKNRTFNEAELPDVPQLNQSIQINPKMPQVLQEKLAQEQLFNQLVSPEIKTEAQNTHKKIKEIIQQQETHIKNLGDQLSQVLNQIGSSGLIQQDSSQMLEKNSLQKQIQEFKSKSSVEDLNETIKFMMDTSNFCQIALDEIVNTLEKEQLENDELKKKFQNQWTREDSNKTNIDYFDAVKDLKSRVSLGQSIDKEISQKFNKCFIFIEKFQKEDQKILQEINSFQKQNFQGSNLHQFQDIITQKVQELESILQICKQVNLNNKEQLSKLNLNQEVAQVFQQSINKLNSEEIVQKIILKYKLADKNLVQNIENFSNKLAEFQKFIKEIHQQNQNKDQKNGQIEEYEQMAFQIKALYSDIDQGLQFYQKIYPTVLDLKQNVDGFIQARNLEKDNLLAIIKGQTQMQKNDKSNIQLQNVQQPWFNEQNLSFPEGTSIFIPNKKNNKDDNFQESVIVSQQKPNNQD